MTQIKLRRDTSAAFASSNPILGNGEPAYETDTKKLKIGDGTTAYTQLEYFSAGGGGSADIGAALPLKIVDGVISLEVDGQTIQIVDGKLHASNNIFDISKFTVVGSPTITDDGVASGFSSSDYLKTLAFDFSKPFTILAPFKLNTIQHNKCIFQIVGADGWWNYVIISSRYASCLLQFSDKTTKTLSMNLSKEYSLNETYYLQLNFTGQEYSFKLLDKDKKVLQQNNYETTLKLYNSTNKVVNLGYATNGSGYNLSNGSIDLKQFSITVDGKEIFSGLMNSTKPIYDAIKASNTELSKFKTETSNDFSAVDSALNEKANLSDLALKQNKLTAGDNITISADNVISGSAPTNMVTTDTAQTITGLKTFGGTDLSKILLEGSESLIGFRENADSLPTTLIGGFFDSNGKKSITIGSKDHETLSLNAKSVQDGSGNKFLTSGNVTAYITKTYVNGTSGYRIWSDGYCEQWGYVTGSLHTVTLLKNYKNTNYGVLAHVNIKSPNEAYNFCWSGTKTVSTFTIGANGGTLNDAWIISNAGTIYWKTEGYIA